MFQRATCAQNNGAKRVDNEALPFLAKVHMLISVVYHVFAVMPRGDYEVIFSAN